jgi:phage terminase small subunit
MSKDKKLTGKMQLFVDEYIIDFNGSEAVLRAGYSDKKPAQQAHRLLKDKRVIEAINTAIAERKERLFITQDQVVTMWWQIANADYNELSSVRRVACGYCYGDSVTLDDDSDGREIDPSCEPNPDCGICRGEGAPHVHIADTSKLSPAAKLLYQGAKETKFGIEVQTVDRMKALDNVARHLGMFKDTVQHTGADGGPIETVHLTPEQVIQRMSEKRDDY